MQQLIVAWQGEIIVIEQPRFQFEATDIAVAGDCPPRPQGFEHCRFLVDALDKLLGLRATECGLFDFPAHSSLPENIRHSLRIWRNTFLTVIKSPDSFKSSMSATAPG